MFARSHLLPAVRDRLSSRRARPPIDVLAPPTHHQASSRQPSRMCAAPRHRAAAAASPCLSRCMHRKQPAIRDRVVTLPEPRLLCPPTGLAEFGPACPETSPGPTLTPAASMAGRGKKRQMEADSDLEARSADEGGSTSAAAPAAAKPKPTKFAKLPKPSKLSKAQHPPTQPAAVAQPPKEPGEGLTIEERLRRLTRQEAPPAKAEAPAADAAEAATPGAASGSAAPPEQQPQPPEQQQQLQQPQQAGAQPAPPPAKAAAAGEGAPVIPPMVPRTPAAPVFVDCYRLAAFHPAGPPPGTPGPARHPAGLFIAWLPPGLPMCWSCFQPPGAQPCSGNAPAGAAAGIAIRDRNPRSET